MRAFTVAVLLAFLCLVLGFTTYWQYNKASDLAYELADASARAKNAEAKVLRIQGAVVQAQKAASVARQKLKDALDADPEYRDSATPVPVRDSLCATLHCQP